MADYRNTINSMRIDPATGVIVSVPIEQKDTVYDHSPIIPLWEIPDKNNRVQCKNLNNTYKVEVFNIKDVEISGENYFYVDYNNQTVYFHSLAKNKTVTLIYRGCGNRRLSSSLIYTKLDSEGEVSEILSDVLEGGKDAITAISTLGNAIDVINELDATIVQANTDKNTIINSIDTKITEGEGIVTNIETAISNGDISTVKSDIVTINSSLSDIPNQTFVTEKAKTVDVNNALAVRDVQIASIASGAPKPYATLTDLQTAYPTGDTNNYVVIADGYIYYWNSSAWTQGWLYQSTIIADKTVNVNKTDFVTLGKNLFDKSKITTGYYYAYNTGVKTVATGYYYSDYIPVLGNTSYCVNQPSKHICFYDANKTYISGFLVSSSPRTFVTPANCVYVILSDGNSVQNTLQFEVGTVTTTFENYKVSIPSISVNYTNMVGTPDITNIVDKTVKSAKLVDFTLGKNLFDKTKATDGYYYTYNTGVKGVDVLRFYSDYIPVLGNTAYFLNSNDCHMCYFNSDKVFISGLLPTNATFTTPSNCAYIIISPKITVKNSIQLEIGTVGTPYTPYVYTLQNLGVEFNNLTGVNLTKIKVTNKVSEKMSNLAPTFFKHWKAKDKDLVAIILGDSLSTIRTDFSSARADANTRPPLMIANSYPTYIEELLRWEGQEYKRFDVSGIFTELCTSASSLDYDSAWDWIASGTGNAKPALTRVLEGTNCSVTYTIPNGARRCDFIYRTDYLNAINSIVSINGGNGIVQVYDENTSTWIEANGYSYVAKEVDQIITGTTGSNLRKSIYQKRLKMRTVVLEYDGTAIVTITNNGSGRLTYWGIQHSPHEYFIDFLAQARGGHNILAIRNFEAWDVDCFKPDLILKQNCTNNENITIGNTNDGISPTHRNANTPQAMADRFLTYTSDLEAKSYAPTVISYTLFHSYFTNWLAKDSNKTLFAYVTDGKVTGFDYHDYLDYQLINNNKKQLMVWKCLNEESKIKSIEENSPIMECVCKLSGINGTTWHVDGTHQNDLGARVIFEIMKPFFIN